MYTYLYMYMYMYMFMYMYMYMYMNKCADPSQKKRERVKGPMPSHKRILWPRPSDIQVDWMPVFRPVRKQRWTRPTAGAGRGRVGPGEGQKGNGSGDGGMVFRQDWKLSF